MMKHYCRFTDFRAEEYGYLFESVRRSRSASRTTSYTPLVDRTLR